MRAAGVVADHAAERAARVGRRIGAEGEAVGLGRLAQAVAHHAGLDAREARRRVERDDAVEVLRAVDDHGNVHRLAVERGAAAARQDGRAVLAAHRDRGLDVGRAAGQHDVDRHLPIVRRIGRIRGARTGVEAYFARHYSAQRRLESLNLYHPSPILSQQLALTHAPNYAG